MLYNISKDIFSGGYMVRKELKLKKTVSSIKHSMSEIGINLFIEK